MFAYTADDHWQLGIGDPTIMGWLTVAAYWIAAAMCWRAATVERKHSGQSKGTVFWTLFACGLAFLGINKQLDLQTWLTLFVKQLAQRQGWYEYRRAVQLVFILAIALVGLASLGLLSWLARGARRQAKWALLGGVFLSCFVLVRASSFHHVDQMLGMRLMGMKVNWILELGGILCITWAAFSSVRTQDHR
jgi:hypothetical protein